MNKKPLRPPSQDNPQIKAYVQAVQKGMQSHHVLPSEDGWKVKRAGASKARKRFATQKEAIAFGKEVAKRRESELFIHGKDGRIRERSSYGKDDFPPRG